MRQRADSLAKALADLNLNEEIVKKAKDIILGCPELKDALSNPAVGVSEKHAVVDAIFDSEIRNFFKVVCDNEGFGEIEAVFAEYEDLMLMKKNIIRATLTYVTMPDEEQLDRMKEMIRNKYNKAGVLLEMKEDPSLLGGFVLTVGNTSYDKSVAGTLEDLHKTLVWR